MTFERKIVVGLDDIKAVAFECKECTVRTTVPIEKLSPEPPRSCPSCKTTWWGLPSPGQHYVTTSGPAILAFVEGLLRSRNLLLEQKDSVRILFIFDEPA